jgi:hypothetical protein
MRHTESSRGYGSGPRPDVPGWAVLAVAALHWAALASMAVAAISAVAAVWYGGG